MNIKDIRNDLADAFMCSSTTMRLMVNLEELMLKREQAAYDAGVADTNNNLFNFSGVVSELG